MTCNAASTEEDPHQQEAIRKATIDMKDNILQGIYYQGAISRETNKDLKKQHIEMESAKRDHVARMVLDQVDEKCEDAPSAVELDVGTNYDMTKNLNRLKEQLHNSHEFNAIWQANSNIIDNTAHLLVPKGTGCAGKIVKP